MFERSHFSDFPEFPVTCNREVRLARTKERGELRPRSARPRFSLAGTFRNLHRFRENIPTLAIDVFYEFIICVIPTQESATSVRHLALQLEEINRSKKKSD